MRPYPLTSFHTALMATALATLTGGFVWGQTTVTYTDGETDSGSYETSPPNDPTTLDVSTGAAEQSGVISGSGSVEKTGGGSLTLSAANTYNGGTKINNGVLLLGNADALGGGTFTINGGGVASDGAYIVNNDMSVHGDFTIFPGGTTPIVSPLELNGDMNLNGGVRTLTNTMDFNAFEFGQASFGGAISNGGLTLSSEPSSLPLPNVVFFRLAGSQANTYTGETTLEEGVSLTLEKSDNVTAVGGDLTVDQESVAVVAAEEQIADDATVTLNGNGQLQVGVFYDVTETIGALEDDGGGLAEVEFSDNGAGSRLVVDSGNFSGTLTGGMAGGNTLRKEGPGTLILSGNNTYLGDTVLDGGTLGLHSDSAISGGTLRVLGSTVQYADGVNISNPIELQNDATMEVNGSDAAEQSGVISETGGSFGISKTGTGTLTLSAANTYTGGTELNEGVLFLGNASALGTGTLTINGGGLASDDAYTVNNDLSVHGDFTLFPGGTTPLISPLELNGDVDLNGGTHTITNTMDFNAFEFGQASFGGVISNGGLTLSSAPSSLPLPNVVFFRLAGTQANTYTGQTTLKEGVSLTLEKSDNVTAVGGDLTVDQESVAVVAAEEQIADDATVTLNGNGQLQLGVFYDVTETIGALEDDGGGLAEVEFSDNGAGSRLVVDSGNFSGTLTGGVAGGNTLRKEGTGTLILSGDNDYLGDTVLDGGTLGLHSNSAISGGTLHVLGSTIQYADGVRIDNPIDLQNNVVLEVGSGDNARQNGVISETGGSYGITKVGGGLLRLTSATTHTGRTVVNEGRLTLRNGGSISTQQEVMIGETATDSGELRVNGVNGPASLSTDGPLIVGNFGEGGLDVRNGGTATADSVAIGLQVDGYGEVFVDGAGSSLTSESSTPNFGYINVGERGLGLLEISNGGTVEAEHMTFGLTADAIGAGEFEGAGSLLDTSGSLVVGSFGAGEVFVTDGARVEAGGDVQVGLGPDSMGILGFLGAGTSFQTSGNVQVGGDGLGVFGFLQGATGTAGNLRVGDSATSSGQMVLRGVGTRLELSGSLEFGISGIAGADIANGSVVSVDQDGTLGVALEGDANIEVRGAGSKLEFGNSLTIGGGGFGRLRIRSGATADASYLDIGGGVDADGRLMVRGPGSVFESRDAEAFVGVDGRGILTVRDGGVFRQSGTSSPIVAGVNPTGNGLVTIGARLGSPGQAGILDVSGLFGGAGRARLRFNHDGTTFLTRDGTETGDPVLLSGGMEVQHRAGSTYIVGPNTHIGGTELSGGTLITRDPAALGSGPFDFSGGGFIPEERVRIGGDFLWSGGTFGSTLGTDTTGLDTTGILDLTGTGEFFFLPGAGFRNKTEYLLVDTGSAISASSSSFNGNPLFTLEPEFRVRGEALYVIFPDSLILSGNTLQNSNPVNVPVFADFRVTGNVTTGTPAEDNVINSLIFENGGSLRVFNTLEVTSGRFNVDTGTGSVFGGQLWVPGTFEKTGTGTLLLLSPVSAMGESVLASGSTFVNGSFVSSGGFRVEDGAFLGGAGTLIGNLLNSGTVGPGNSIDTLTIDGTYTQGANGALEIEYANASTQDHLMITGAAVLDGTLKLIQTGSGVSYGDSARILTALGGISGRFSNIAHVPAGFRARQWRSGNGTVLNLLFAPASYTQVAQGTNQTAVAAALDQWLGSTHPEYFAATFDLDRLRASQYPAVFERALPHLYAALTERGLTDAYNDGRGVMSQARAARWMPRSEPESDRHGWRLWTDLRGGYSDTDVFSMDEETGTLLMGMDQRVGDAVVGLYVGGRDVQSDTGSVVDYEGEGIRYGIYGSVGVAESGYVSLAAGGGRTEYDTERPVPFGDGTSASPEGSDWYGRLEAGWRTDVGVRLSPFVGLQYSKSTLDAFTENSGSVYALALEEVERERTEGYAGLELSKVFRGGDSASVFRPYARVLYRSDFSDNPQAMTARLDQGRGASFDYQPNSVDTDGVEAGAGIGWSSTETGWGANLGYTGVFGDDRESHLVNLGISFGR